MNRPISTTNGQARTCQGVLAFMRAMPADPVQRSVLPN